jgi:molybdate-binding protein
VVLVGWAKRQRGLIVARAAGRKIEAIADLRGRRVTPRQAESGAQALFGHLLGRAGLSPEALGHGVPGVLDIGYWLLVIG